jgi:hypothetical protein
MLSGDRNAPLTPATLNVVTVARPTVLSNVKPVVAAPNWHAGDERT